MIFFFRKFAQEISISEYYFEKHQFHRQRKFEYLLDFHFQGNCCQELRNTSLSRLLPYPPRMKMAHYSLCTLKPLQLNVFLRERDFCWAGAFSSICEALLKFPRGSKGVEALHWLPHFSITLKRKRERLLKRETNLIPIEHYLSKQE